MAENVTEPGKQGEESGLEARQVNDLQPRKDELADIEPGQEGKPEKTETFHEKHDKKDGGCCGS